MRYKNIYHNVLNISSLFIRSFVKFKKLFSNKLENMQCTRIDLAGIGKILSHLKESKALKNLLLRSFT